MSRKNSLGERLQQFVQLVVGLSAAGTSHATAVPTPTTVLGPDVDLDRYTHSQPLNADSSLLARGHRSHSSHSSHRSHSSHYSSSGGSGYAAPPPAVYTPPSTSAPSMNVAPIQKSSTPSNNAPTSSTPKPLYSTPGAEIAPPANAASQGLRTQDALRMLVMRVQAALLLKNYDPGEVNGTMSAATITALKKYQKDRGLNVTGTINAQTLDALAIRAGF